jgi:serine/threonine protein kinase
MVMDLLGPSLEDLL